MKQYTGLIDKDMQIGEIWSRSFEYKKQVQVAYSSIRRFFSLCESPYLALSWGKQSICLAHMVYHIRPETPMVFLRSWESYYLHDFERVISEFTKRWTVNWIDHYCDNVSWNDYDWKKTRDIGSKDIQEMADNVVPDWDGVVMGLSKDESKGRRITTSLNTTQWRTIFKYKDGKYRNTPIQSWSQNDLAAYIYENKIPLLSAYINGGLRVRTTARITRNAAEMNGLKELKFRDMDAYNKIIKRFPELSVR
jgi:3'-phosphoadenosine 5'-phosphosulfate sulfotransferase (PAPS reductase)/FAD synthetase